MKLPKPPPGYQPPKTRLGISTPGRKLGGRVGSDAAPISSAGSKGSGRVAK